MVFTGDCSGSAKGTGVPPICNPIYIHNSNPFQHIVWLKSDNLELYSLQNESNQYILFHILFHI